MGGGLDDRSRHACPGVEDIRRRLLWWRKESCDSALNSLPDKKSSGRRGLIRRFSTGLRRWLKLVDAAVEDLRGLGPFCLVCAEVADAKIIVRLI